MHALAKLDHQFVWHPFTQMREWLQREPTVIVAGKGAVVWDVKGREYLDANASIWTNIHGHNHPEMNAAIRRQLGKIAHSSALGLANEPASMLAARLVKAISPPKRVAQGSPKKSPQLAKVFFSDDGSTAMEVALKLSYEFTRRTGRSRKPRFLSLANAYHGDTVGAAALGQIDLFRKRYSGLLFKTDRVMAPYCYRCRFNRAKPERADARTYRKCNWECIQKLEAKFQKQSKRGDCYSAFVFEPLIQGAAGMIPQPEGWLGKATEIARGHRALLIADEVMTGFGRTGAKLTPASKNCRPATRGLFACDHENVTPDLLAIAKGLTGGYLPLAATLTTQEIFDVFLGEYHEFKTFFHGHSFTGNQLGCAAALKGLELLETPASIQRRQLLADTLASELKALWNLPTVGDIRQVGLVAGVELVKDWRTRRPFSSKDRIGWQVCQAMARRGVLTRPIGDVIVLMPPYCTTGAQVRKMLASLHDSILEVAPR